MVRCDTACALKLQSLVDPATVHGQLKARTLKTRAARSTMLTASLLWESEGAISSCGIALVTQLLGDDRAKRERRAGETRSLVSQYGLKARAAKAYRLHQIASLVPSVMHGQPDRQAERLAALGAHQGFAKLAPATRAEWRELWKGRILLHGAGRGWQQRATPLSST